MSAPLLGRQTRKRLATRRAISQAADRLFLERGFENVTVDQIAAAADVGRMTVFNHFPRKEDMFFDRDEEGREVLRDALRTRDTDITPVETLRLLAHRMIDEAPYLQFSVGSRNFVATIERSETLKARARSIRDELADTVALALSETLEADAVTSSHRLVAALLVATWATAFIEAHQAFRENADATKARAVFLTIVDQGSRSLETLRLDK